MLQLEPNPHMPTSVQLHRHNALHSTSYWAAQSPNLLEHEANNEGDTLDDQTGCLVGKGWGNTSIII
jgi:hypothetical protein